MFYVGIMSAFHQPISSEHVLVIAGPTGGGKSSIAMDIAEKCESVIINADSMQVYSDLCILTARPSTQDHVKTPHVLYGVIDGNVRCNVNLWLARAKKEVEKARMRGKLPILVGGTGLYLNAARHGISQIPSVSELINQKVINLHNELGGASFKKFLNCFDPQTASRLADGDSQRLVRAMGVFWQTGKSLSYWQSQPLTGAISGIFINVTNLPPRKFVYDSINLRVSRMMQEGVIDEVRLMLERNLDKTLPVMKALGVRQIASYLDHQMDLNSLVSSISQDTRNYAKRQFTWFNNNFISEIKIQEKYSKRIVSKIFSKIPK